MKAFRYSLLSLLAVTFSCMAFAASDIYRDTYTVENSGGYWTFHNQIAATRTTLNLKATITTITRTVDTTGVVTATKSGTFFVLDFKGTAGPYEMDLPLAEEGLIFHFLIATDQTVSIRPDSSTSTADRIRFSNLGPGDILNSPASSGTSVTLIGVNDNWYIGQMTHSQDDVRGTSLWTDGGAGYGF